MVAGKVADGLYHPVHDVEKRGFSVDVPEDSGAGVVAEKEKPENILPLLADADVAAGEAITKKCLSCHTFEQGGANKVGPNLYDIVGNTLAHKGDFTYSDAMASHGGNWDYNSLSSFLKKPKDFVPGTKMAFAGISKEGDRANLIAYLRTLSGSPKPLPSEAEIAASMPEEEPEAETEEAASAEEAASDSENGEADTADSNAEDATLPAAESEE